MTHPLAQFGLDEDADERAVKRAYAKRLKVTRPDEDATAFQALNEAYQQALAYIRWRDASNAQDKVFLEEPAEVAGAPVASDDPVHIPEPHRIPADEIFLLEDEPEFHFSLPDFMDSFARDRRDRDPECLREWLRGQMAEWPLTAKPQIAYTIVSHIVENDIGIRPDVLDALVDELGLNDIRSASVEPVVIARYRDEMERRYAVPVKKTLFDRVSTAIGKILIVGLLLNLAAHLFFSRTYEKPPASELAPWYRTVSARSDAAIVLQPQPGVSEEMLSLIAKTPEPGQLKSTILSIDSIAKLSNMPELSHKRILAAAMYNIGTGLEENHRDEAFEACRELQTRFRGVEDHDIALMVAASYVHMGGRHFGLGEFSEAMQAYGMVVSEYGSIDEGQIGMQLFKAYLGLADLHIAQGQLDQAYSVVLQSVKHFENSPDPVLRLMAPQRAAVLLGRMKKSLEAPP